MIKIFTNDKKANIICVEGDIKMNSPFNVSFGEEPKNLIKRTIEFEQVTSVFDSDMPETKIMMITGARGCGKTVLLSEVKNYYDNKDNWITVDINPNGDILAQLASKIYETGKVKKLFLKAEFNFSFHGLGLSIHGDESLSSIYTLLDNIFKYLKKKEIKVLITIDDVSCNDNVKLFVHSYQEYLREGYLTYLLLTGLYENIDKLEKTDNITFLARAPKIYLSKLNLRAITMTYMSVFGIGEDDAIQLAKQTNGYAYGFQLLGSILYKNNKTKIDDSILSNYDLQLEDNAYSLIWRSLTNLEQKILFGIAATSGANKEILNYTNLNNATLQIYKIRLSKKGLIDSTQRGKIAFVLPRFKEFVLFQLKVMEE